MNHHGWWLGGGMAVQVPQLLLVMLLKETHSKYSVKHLHRQTVPDLPLALCGRITVEINSLALLRSYQCALKAQKWKVIC